MFRIKPSFFNVWIVMVILAPFCLWGADQPVKSMALFAEFNVYPGKIVEYGEIVSTFMNWYREYVLPYSILAYAMDNYDGHYLIPLENSADLERYTEAKQGIIKKVGEKKWDELIGRESACYSGCSYSLLRYCEEISLKPKNRKYSLDDSHFSYWGYYYVIPGKEAEFKTAFKRIIEFYNTLDFKDIDYGWDFYKFVTGRGKPLYLMIHPGKNVVDFWQQAEKRQTLAGKQLVELFYRVLENLQNFEVKTGYYLPEISHISR